MVYLRKTNAVIIALMVMIVSVAAVVNVDAASVRLNKTSVTLEEGQSDALKVKGTNQKVKWNSSNKKIVSVSSKGKIKALKKGSAVVTAKVSGKKLKCKVTVKKAPLSTYWTKGSQPAEHLKDYVARVTDPSNKKDYIPVKDRIAVFDMDGTLICEQYFSYYDTVMFKQYCLKDHPERVSEELKQAAEELKPGYKAGEELARNFAKAYKDMTIEELYEYAVEFGQKKTSSFTNMRYNQGAYLPMVEVVKYLYDNDFTIYVVSGTERTTSRAIIDNSPYAEYITHNHIIGTEFDVKVKGHEDEPSNMNYNYAEGDELVFNGGFVQKNLNANKPIFIEKEIGRRPVLAFGNSSSDYSMLDYTLDSRNKYPTAAYVIIADDTEREWGPDDWDKKSAQCIEKNYIPVSMKNDFAQIYEKGVEKGEKQYDPDEWKRTDEDSGDLFAKLRNAA